MCDYHLRRSYIIEWNLKSKSRQWARRISTSGSCPQNRLINPFKRSLQSAGRSIAILVVGCEQKQFKCTQWSKNVPVIYTYSAVKGRKLPVMICFALGTCQWENMCTLAGVVKTGGIPPLADDAHSSGRLRAQIHYLAFPYQEKVDHLVSFRPTTPRYFANWAAETYPSYK